MSEVNRKNEKNISKINLESNHMVSLISRQENELKQSSLNSSIRPLKSIKKVKSLRRGTFFRIDRS